MWNRGCCALPVIAKIANCLFFLNCDDVPPPYLCVSMFALHAALKNVNVNYCFVYIGRGGGGEAS